MAALPNFRFPLVTPASAYSGQTVGGPGSGSMSINGISPELALAYGLVTPQQLAGGASRTTSSSGSSGASSPYEASAMAHLQSVLNGSKLPYDQATQNAMMTQGSDMSGAAEAAQLQQTNSQALANGASASDPSLQGLAREYMAQRQGQNQQTANAVAQQASKANFAAQSDAARTMADYGLAQQDRQYRAQQALRSGAYDTVHSAPGSSTTGRVQGYSGLDMTGWQPYTAAGQMAQQQRSGQSNLQDDAARAVNMATNPYQKNTSTYRRAY